jgi:spoIIIJ-associated protein
VQWVEVTGRTVEEAKESALDQLGVDEQDAEFEVLEEPKSGLFGRLRTEARVRARVLPQTPRPKMERRERRRGSGGGSRERSRSGGSGGGGGRSGGRGRGAGGGDRAGASERSGGSGSGGGGDGNGGEARSGGRKGRTVTSEQSESQVEAPTLAEEAAEAAVFLEGLLGAFDLEGSLASNELDEETVEVSVSGDDLGLLIGPKGQTLTAIQELTRTVVQRRLGARSGRLLVDVADYRKTRRAALERFATDLAGKVKEAGVPTALEPMSPADRKVVHDTVNAIDGVTTTSEGEEPHRRVVILPDQG